MYIWSGTNDADRLKVEEIYTKNAQFSVTNRLKRWNSVINIYYDPPTQKWQVIVQAKYFGRGGSPDSELFKNAMDELSIELGFPPTSTNYCSKTSDKYWCDIDPSTCITGCQEPTDQCKITEHTPFANDDLLIPLLMFNINKEASTEEGFIKLMMDSWFPFCNSNPTNQYIGCVNNFQFRGDYPAINPDTGIFYHSTNNSLGSQFKTSAFSKLTFLKIFLNLKIKD